MNKKERRLALATALQSAASDVVVVDDIKQAAGAGQTGQAPKAGRNSKQCEAGRRVCSHA